MLKKLNMFRIAEFNYIICSLVLEDISYNKLQVFKEAQGIIKHRIFSLNNRQGG